MTISTFAARHSTTSWHDYGTPIRRAYLEQKRLDAEQRQAAFDAEVDQVVAEQHCHPRDARLVVNARRRATRRSRG